MAREYLRGLREAVRKLPKHHRAGVQYMGYSGLGRWIDRQARRHGVPALVVSARRTSSECPRCNNMKMKEVEHRTLECPEVRL